MNRFDYNSVETKNEATPLLPDIISSGLDVVFIGAAASHWSAEAGHYYAGPNNRFWKLLFQAGFTPHQFEADQDEQLLKYGIGLTCLFKHVASGANHLLPPPSQPLRQELINKLILSSPSWICCNGKDVYRMVFGKDCLDWGEQWERIGGSRLFIVHSSSARADHWGNERLALYKELKQRIEETRAKP